MGLMTPGQVLVNGSGGVSRVAAEMGGNSSAAMEDLHRHGGLASVQLLPHQLKGDAVVMPIDLDVIVDVGSNRLPPREDVAFGQTFERRPVGLLEYQGATDIATFAKRMGVQSVEQFGNGFVEIGEMEELAVTQRGYDPALRYLNSCLDFGFNARFVGTSGNNCEAMMLGQFAVS